MVFKGKVYKFGDDINTDEIIPARFLNTTNPDVLGLNCMEDTRPGFGKTVEKGSIIAAGNNFGCGSSREHAPLSIKYAGISCVLAKSFARIFFRNAINIGLPIIQNKEVVNILKENDIITIDLNKGNIVLPNDKIVLFTPFPHFMREIIKHKGWIQYLTKHYSI